MLVELEKAIGWLKENADKYIVDMAIPSYEHDYHIGGKCWEDLKAAMPEAERPKIMATLVCEEAEVEWFADEEEAKIAETVETVRREIDHTVVNFDYMPSSGEMIAFFNKRGWYYLTVRNTRTCFATEDADVRDERKGRFWNNIVISNIEIMELNENTDKEDK